MKIKIINPDVNEGISFIMEKSAQKVVSSNTEITCMSPPSGPRSINNAFTKEIAGNYILEEIIQSEKEEHFDGYVIACFADPSLHAAREITDKPVVGIGEASVMLAQLLGENFSIITVGPESRWVYKGVVNRCGANSRLASLRSPIMQSEDAYTNAESIKELVIKESKIAIEEDFAEVIILGCGVMTELAEAVQDIIKVPVLNPVAAGVKAVEALVELGMKTSKAYSYKTPKNPALINVPESLHINGGEK